MNSKFGLKFVVILLALIIIIGGGAFFYNYYFVKTLMLSEVIGKTDYPQVTTLCNLFDFNTGLTRYDINRIEGKAYYWKKRIITVNSIQDPKKKELEAQKLITAMMKDPQIKKILRKIVGLGLENILASFSEVRDKYPLGNRGWWLFWIQ